MEVPAIEGTRGKRTTAGLMPLGLFLFFGSFFFFFFFFFVISLFFSTTGYNTYNNLLTLHVTIHYLYLQLNYMTIYNTLLEVYSLG